MTATPLLGALDGLTAEQVNGRFLAMMAAEEFGAIAPLDEAAFAGIVQELYVAPRRFTYIDLFCGAGGSSIGLTMAGGRLLLAANHSKRAIETHQANFRDADHECADINHYDMRKLPRGAHILWASPICTEISPAGGRKRTKKALGPDQLELLKFGPVTADVFERTRATFHDVIRAAEAHRFPYVIVENVVEAVTDWELFGWWLDGMVLLEYEWQLVCVSSAHIGADANPHAPQRRDRVYIVFNRRDAARPDVAPRPLSFCDTCGDVAGVQWWKKPNGTLTASGRYFHVGKYGKRTGQYVYRCPNAACKHAVATPYERPAASVIDWSDLGVRICDRPANDPLAAATLRRIAWGFELFGRPTLVNSAHSDDRAYPADATPFPSATTKIGHGLAVPFLDSNGGSWNRGPAGVDVPFRTRTVSEWEALVVPPGAFIETARRNVVPTSVRSPLTTVSAQGNHHGLVVPYYRTGRATPTSEPLPTCTVRDRFGLAQMGGDGVSMDDVMQAHYRMVQWYEQARAQRFPRCYLITGNNGERTAQAGNAVSANVAQWLGERCADALNRTAAVAWCSSR